MGGIVEQVTGKGVFELIDKRLAQPLGFQDFVRSRKEFDAIDFRLELAPAPQIVRGSPVMLGQVAVNLILNACEAQPSGGEVMYWSMIASIPLNEVGKGKGKASTNKIVGQKKVVAVKKSSTPPAKERSTRTC